MGEALAKPPAVHVQALLGTSVAGQGSTRGVMAAALAREHAHAQAVKDRVHLREWVAEMASLAQPCSGLTAAQKMAALRSRRGLD